MAHCRKHGNLNRAAACISGGARTLPFKGARAGWHPTSMSGARTATSSRRRPFTPMDRFYRWLSIGGLATAPGWLVELTRKPAPAPIKLPPRTHNGPPGAYGAAALEREIDELAAAPRGCRNHALNKASFCLHQLVAGGELDGADVERELLAAAATNGLLADPQDGPASVLRTIRSGARAGLQNPRSRS
jgi:hypothetical protein